MKYSSVANLPATQAEGDCLLLAVYQNNELSVAAKAVDEASGGTISDYLQFGDFNAEVGDSHFLYQVAGIQAKRILLVGTGEQTKFDIYTLNKVTKIAAKQTTSSTIASIISYLGDELFNTSNAVVMQSILAFTDSRYKFTIHKSDAEAVDNQKFTVAFSEPVDNLDESLNTATGVALGCNLSRDLSNQPGNVCTPTYLADTALKMSQDYDEINVEVLEDTDMKKLGMGSFLSVSQGSSQPGKMIVLSYNGLTDEHPPIALVGKGVTFDTGGLSLKPSKDMDEMKFDMIGAASVVGTIKACAEMKLPVNIVGVLAAAENMPSEHATRPGDIVTSMSGKTIEVLDTDAEGRLVLCDALTYVGKYKPRVVIDIATLTGACIVALGHEICAVISNDQSLADEILASGKAIGDQAWQLPMNDDYQKLLKSEHADIGNIGGKTAGTITAACFLAHFTENYRWAHLDIAGTAWHGKAATGRPVPLLTQFLIDQVNNVKY